MALTKTQDVESKLPVHIGIIMDGNGRWAKKRFLPRSAGHRAVRPIFAPSPAIARALASNT